MKTSLQKNWFERLINRLYNANINRLVIRLRLEAPTHYHRLVTDFSFPMDATFESAVAKTLNRFELIDFRPSEVLLPRMMKQYDVEETCFQNAELKSMSNKCNQCEHISQCWTALRSEAEPIECKLFCPNSDKLIAKATLNC